MESGLKLFADDVEDVGVADETAQLNGALPARDEPGGFHSGRRLGLEPESGLGLQEAGGVGAKPAVVILFAHPGGLRARDGRTAWTGEPKRRGRGRRGGG